MPKLVRKRVVLAKIETTYGTDPTPTGSANAIQVSNLAITPINAETVNRDLIRSYLGNSQELLANNYVVATFEVEMAGSGALGTAPAYGPLLRACACAEAITASTKVEYTPISAAFEAVTIYFYVDGVLHKMTGCMGNVELDISARKIPVYKFTMFGLYNAVTDTALPTPVYTGFRKPLVANKVNTPTFSFFGVTSLVLEQMVLQVGNQVNFRSLIGAEYVHIVDRKTTSSVKFEMVPVATLDIFGTAIGTTTGALQLIHGTAAGDKVQIDAPVVDVGAPSYEESDGIQMVNVPLSLIPSSGNDEFKITII